MDEHKPNTPAEANGTRKAEGTLSSERAELAKHATWQIEPLARSPAAIARKYERNDIHAALHAIAMRVHALNSVAISALGDSAYERMSLDPLWKVVRGGPCGVKDERELSHG